MIRVVVHKCFLRSHVGQECTEEAAGDLDEENRTKRFYVGGDFIVIVYERSNGDCHVEVGRTKFPSQQGKDEYPRQLSESTVHIESHSCKCRSEELICYKCDLISGFKALHSIMYFINNKQNISNTKERDRIN